ncbi:hypothetical protein ACHAWF_009257 [Thalassiosira exigua]
MAASIDFPPPPPPPPAEEPDASQRWNAESISKGGDDVDQFIWAHGRRGHHLHDKPPSSLDRNVLHFLENVDFDDIGRRKLDRLGAVAAALVARRSFRFSAVDGTGLGWSSSSLAKCLSRLTSLREEHGPTLRDSFYPLRLVLSADEFRREIDLYGGEVRLNPAATDLQWLETLGRVDDEGLRTHRENVAALRRYLDAVERAFDAKVVRGRTCEPESYHRCLERLVREVRTETLIPPSTVGMSLPTISHGAKIVVESEQARRRARLRDDGNFEVGAGLSSRQIRKALSDFAGASQERRHIEAEVQTRRRRLASRAAYDFGVQGVHEASPTVKTDQVCECLSRLLEKDEAEKELLRGYLAGQSIGIAARGHLCHLGDDGSIVIPTNCT